MTATEPGCTDASPGGGTPRPDGTDGLGEPREAEPRSFRERIHSNPAMVLPWRIAVFLVGLLFVMLGVALTALPGPLTIPPVLLGLWIWSSEFQWAARFFAVFKRRAQDAWRHAQRHRVSSAAVTIGGLAAAGLGFWAVGHFHLVDQAKNALGI